MGSRKRNAATERKEALKSISYAKLNNCPTSPRKMRLVADLVRGKKVTNALNTLRFSSKEAAGRLEKLLLSAISNWQAKNPGVRIEDHDLVVKEVYVDGGRQLKRMNPAPQGRAYRLRKRSNHITLIVDSLTPVVNEVEEMESTEETSTENQTENNN